MIRFRLRPGLGFSKLVLVLVIAGVVAGGVLGVFMVFRGGGIGTETTTTSSGSGRNYLTLELSCSNGEIAEVAEAYSKSGDYCWGWLGSHTYSLGAGIFVESAGGTVKIGPSEGVRSGTLYIEVKGGNGEWSTLESESVSAGSSTSFSVSVGREITAIRLRVSPPPGEDDWVSVDSSSITVKVPVGSDEVIHHNCHEGVHEEAQEAKEATGDYCWGWLSTHTYDLGKERNIDLIVVVTKLGPSGFSGAKGSVVIEISTDGTNWVKVFDGSGFIGGPLDVAASSMDGAGARYVRVSSGSGNYIDYSDVYVAVRP